MSGHPVRDGDPGRRRSPALFLALALVLASRATVEGQSVDAVVQGVVSDPTGAGLPQAAVTLTNAATGLVRVATTDEAGRYRVPPVPAGVYTVKAEHERFQSYVRVGQLLHVGTTVTLDIVLGAPTAAETVTVTGGAALESSDQALSRLVGSAEIDALPVVDRNFNALASLAPGVSPTGIYGGVDIGGSRDFQNGYHVDGVSAEGLGLGDQRMAYAQDWIQEFQVHTSQYPVEFGRASGGYLNAITRSGSNLFSARAYGFLRNEAWDATPAFAATKAPLTMKRVGGTAGGRVIRDRLFYFGGLEHFDHDTARVVNASFGEHNGSVPAGVRQTLSLARLDYHSGPSAFRVRVNGDVRRRTNDGVDGTSTPEHGTSAHDSGREVVGTWNRMAGSAAFNELRLAYSATKSDTRCNFAMSHPPGTWFERNYPGTKLGCPTSFGRIDSGEIQLIDNVTWTRGRHDLKAGVQVSRGRSAGDFRMVRDGTYIFAMDVPFDVLDPRTYPMRFIIFEGPTTWDYPHWSGGAFVHDSWRVTSRLTLHGGVRYDLDGSYTALNRRFRTDRPLTPVRLDRDNLAPRAGFTWIPFGHGRTKVRGGIGRYFDEDHEEISQLLLQLNVLVDRSIFVVANSPGMNPFCPATCAGDTLLRASAQLRQVLADALASNTIPDLTTLPGASGGTPDWDAALQVPFTVQASGGVSHTFRHGLTASADVLVSRGVDQYTLRDVNYDRDAALEGRVVRPEPRYTFINRYGNDGWFTYRALYLQAGWSQGARRLARVSYTLAANESNTNTALRGLVLGGIATNPFDLDEDIGPTNNDIRHNLSATGVTRTVVGMHLAGVLSVRSALPWSVATDNLGDRDPFPDRPEPRNARRGDNHVSLDLRVSRPFMLEPSGRLTVFVELFNLTNATNFTAYQTQPTAAGFARPTQAHEKRRLQLGFRIEF